METLVLDTGADLVLPLRPFLFRKLQRPSLSALPNFTDPTGGANTGTETNNDGKPDEEPAEDDDVDDSESETSLKQDSGVKEDW